MAIGKFISPAQAGSVFTSNFALTVVSYSSNAVNLSWLDPFGNEDGFKIERSADGVNYSVVGTVAANTLAYTHNITVSVDSTYYYRIRSFKGANYSDYSSVVSVTYVFTGWYGVQIDEANSSPDLTRIASDMNLHINLPVQSAMRACLLNDNGTVNYYLKSTDWTKKADESASNLDGTDGQVMIEIPAFYYEVKNNYPSAGQHQVRISISSETGMTLMPRHYIGAYQAVLNRSTLKLSSLINLTTTYRGGNNTSAWDADSNKTLLGRAVTSLSRTQFKTYAQNRGSGWNINTYTDHKWLYWLYAIEYATLNSQKAVDATLTSEGYKKGGLGNGVTTVDSSAWNTLNSYNPFIVTGSSNSLANGSGEVSVSTGLGTVKVPRYRGIEHPFGYLYCWLEGANIEVQPAGGVSNLWINDNPITWSDSVYDGYTNRGAIARSNGYVKKILMGAHADILPIDITGAGTTYYCDYFYTSLPGTTTLRGLFVGGSAYDGTSAGFAYSITAHTPSIASASIGSRLRFLAP